MSSFPNFSNIEDYVQTKLEARRGNPFNISQLNAWVRITSGTSPAGLVLVSNSDFKLFKAAGSFGTGIYGNGERSGTVGTTWGGSTVNSMIGQGYRPSPIVTSLEIDEGSGNLSRKATFSITAHSKEQMEELSEYFMEPGFSVFIEWGWNTADGASGLQSLNASNISQFQSFANTNKVREKAKGDYDNYLGFMTGGGVALSGDKWTLTVNCTGYTELPAYLLTTETGGHTNDDANVVTAKPYGVNTIVTSGQKQEFAKQRWMRVFNELPDTRKTTDVKSLENELSKIENFIGFDDAVADRMNDDSDGGWGFKGSAKVDGEKVKFPKGTKIVSDKKFIKFSALMKIISRIGIDGYKLGNGKVVKFEIDTENTYCSAFRNIYSIDPDKLFIPNQKTPQFLLNKVTADSTIEAIISKVDTVNNAVIKSGGGVFFPSSFSLNYTPTIGEPIKKKGGEWGKLEDLYVNFEFAKSVLETKNFFVKDALYQILNGMSSAVNGMWDFQIQETESDGVTKLEVVELNLVTDSVTENIQTFDLIGEKSIFIDSSFDLDIGGAMMNQIIGQRLNRSINSDAKPISNTFSDIRKRNFIKTDLLNVTIEERKRSNDTPPTDNTDKDEETLKEENLNVLLGNLFLYPRVQLREHKKSSIRIRGNIKDGLYNALYLGAFKDSNIFSALKVGDINKKVQQPQISPLMPINFSFTIHGISGIKRGDKFKVNGIPKKYENGFFQVLSVKHTLDGMMWKTEISGGYRRVN